MTCLKNLLAALHEITHLDYEQNRRQHLVSYYVANALQNIHFQLSSVEFSYSTYENTFWFLKIRGGP